MSNNSSPAVNARPAWRVGMTLRYVGPEAASPVNRTILAPYGPHADRVSFRRFEGREYAEVLTSRGSQIVRVEHLEDI